MSLKEKGQYALALGVIAVMLFIVGFPVVILAFFGVLAFFVWKVFTAETRAETRRVFEFYLAANEVLRDDERRWYGFEIREVIAKGEAVVKAMSAPPPLVYFGLGALSRKLGDHSAAVRYLSQVVEAEGDESNVVFPSRDLREYVRMLRKIERAPAEAPLTSAAIRALERARRNRSEDLLEDSRRRLAEEVVVETTSPDAPPMLIPVAHHADGQIVASLTADRADDGEADERTAVGTSDGQKRAEKEERKTISEVLHEIYDRNVH